MKTNCPSCSSGRIGFDAERDRPWACLSCAHRWGRLPRLAATTDALVRAQGDLAVARRLLEAEIGTSSGSQRRARQAALREIGELEVLGIEVMAELEAAPAPPSEQMLLEMERP